MADYLASQPVRSVASENETRISNSSNVVINPATEETLSAINGKLNSLGQKTSANSVPVVISSDQSAIPVSLSPVVVTAEVSYDTATVASGASNTHSYTPTASKSLRQIVVSGGARQKIEVQYGPTGSETTKAVLFTSASNPTAALNLPEGISLGTGDTVKVIRTNTDNQSQDVYSTIVLN